MTLPDERTETVPTTIGSGACHFVGSRYRLVLRKAIFGSEMLCFDLE